MFGGCKPTHIVSQIHIKCLWSVWATSYAVDRHMGSPLHSCTCAGGGKIPNFGKMGLRVSPNNIMVSCLVDVNHPTLLLTSILHVLKVFEHLHMLWMGMWVHPYTVAPVDVGPNFGNMGVRVSPNSHHGAMFGGYKPPHFVTHIHIKCLWSVWAISYAVDVHMGAPLHSYTCAGGRKSLK